MPDTLSAQQAERIAVIDVGSNSVRLVIFGDSDRAPLTMLNEKAFCRLGAGVVETGRLNPEGVTQAIDTLRRFRWLAESSGARRVLAFATAAVRDASDGPELVERARRECGVKLNVLSGKEEAQLAGMGVLFGIPEAEGLVADMGGSSMELAPLSDRRVGDGCTLPVGPLQYGQNPLNPERIAADVDRHLAAQGWLDGHRGKTLYLVGGTWRAFAKLDIGMRNYGLNIIQNYEMDQNRARELTQLVSLQSPASMTGAHDISDRRLRVLPATSVVLERLLHHLEPDKLVFSAHGVREGAYYAELPVDARKQDPLIAGIRAIALHEARFGPEFGQELFDWMSVLFTGESPKLGKLRLAACLLSDVGWRTHPDYRATQSYRRILRAPLMGIDHAERTFLAIAVLRRYSQKAGSEALRDARAVLDPESILQAEQIGAVMRLALTLGGGNRGSLKDIHLAQADGSITLNIPERLRFLSSEATQARLNNVAKAFSTSPDTRFT